ncbi:MAG TPA: aldehyde dehydrogenase, partial [Gemmatimonadetes bacterium]|nr:aldehyde dehydrogenase [Gemmatimonadota bacterium]
MSKVAEVFETLEYGPAPESAQFANEWLDKHGRAFGHFIGGNWTDPAVGVSFETANPATAEPIAKICQGTVEHVEAAVAAARVAQPGWWDLGSHARARYLYAIARKIQKHARLLAVLESMDNGKPIRESRDLDIPLVARHFYHHAGWAQLMEDELPDYEPLGVVGQIIPWNFPLLMLSWK